MSALVVLGVPFSAWGQSAPGSQYQAYSLKYKSAADMEKILVEMLARTGSDTRVVADPQANQILVRGPASAQQIVQDLIATVDRPSQPARRDPPDQKPTVKAYPCPEGRQNELVAELQGLYEARNDVRVAADPQSGQILVLAPASIHEQIARRLGSGPRGSEMRSGPSRPAGREDSSDAVVRFVPLGRLPVERAETMLRELLGPRLIPSAAHVENVRHVEHQYRFADARGRRAEIFFDPRHRAVQVAGAAALVDQFVRLIENLDDSRQSAGRTVQVLPIHNADPAKVREAVEAYRSGASEAPRRLVPRDSGDGGEHGEGRSSSAPGRNDQSRDFPNAGIELASYLLQQGAGGQGAAGASAGGQGAAGAAAPAAAPPEAAPGKPAAKTPAEEAAEAALRRERLRELGPEVEVETLPDLDVIILRGREHDVQELRRIIEEIERISAETQPTIDIYQLKYVRDQSLSDLIDEVQQDLIGGRQGRVTITPLGKPNALLLIGWGEAVKAAKELIAKLDQPVAPQTQQRLFRLKHASATTVMSTIQEFFQNRAGLGPKVLVTSDPRTNSLIVDAAPRDLEEVALMVARLDVDSSEAVLQTRVFKLLNTLANDVYATLQGAIDAARGGGRTGEKSAALELLMVAPGGERMIKSGILNDVRVTPDVRLNTLIVSAPARSMDLVAALIQQLDAPGAAAQIKVFHIVNGDANSMIETLRGLVPAQVGVGPGLAAAAGESSLVPLRFSVDQRTNSIIAVGSPGDLSIIWALITRLDTEEVQQRKTEVYRLKNSPANDIAVAVNQFLQTRSQLQLAVPGAYNPFQQIESEVVVVPEPVSNSLIISATPRFFEEVKDLVVKLDAEPAQVMIQVLIATVTLSDANQFGVELGLQDSVLFNRSLLDKIFTITNTQQTSTPSGIITNTEQQIVGATNTPGFQFNGPDIGNSGATSALTNANKVGGQGISNFSMGRSDPALGFGGLVLSASSESVSVLLRALQESQRMDVLGRPQIMTLDNQPAFIQIGKRVPRITGTQMNQIGQTNTIDLVNVGLILGVTPRISPEGLVVMEIDAEKSDVGPEAEGVPVSVVGTTVIRSPSFDTTMAQTTVSAHDGETIVLGGLITRQTTKIERKVPYLGDVPVLGNLFSYKSKEDERSELLVILTPHVIRGQEEMERIKRVESARMHWCLEDVYQVHGSAGLTKNGGQVIYPDTNPRGQPSNESAPPRPAKGKSDKEPAPGLEAIPPSLPLPEPVPMPPPTPGTGPPRAQPPQPPAKSSAATSQRPPSGGVVPAAYPPAGRKYDNPDSFDASHLER